MSTSVPGDCLPPAFGVRFYNNRCSAFGCFRSPSFLVAVLLTNATTACKTNINDCPISGSFRP